MSLPDFVLARIADDEYFGTHDRHLARRWGVECDVKRRIVEQCTDGLRWDVDCSEGHAMNLAVILATLALPYADHPSYREEWKP